MKNSKQRCLTPSLHTHFTYTHSHGSVDQDVDRARQVYKKCLEIIPHKQFSFSKIWVYAGTVLYVLPCVHALIFPPFAQPSLRFVVKTLRRRVVFLVCLFPLSCTHLFVTEFALFHLFQARRLARPRVSKHSVRISPSKIRYENTTRQLDRRAAYFWLV